MKVKKVIKTKKSLILFLMLLMVSLAFAVVNQPTLNSPSNQTFTNDNTPDFNFTITGNWTSYSCELFLNGTGYGTNTSTANNTATIITANDTIPDNFYNWYINCTNSTTNQSEIREITIDTIAPSITVDYPLQNHRYNNYTGWINVTTDGVLNCSTDFAGTWQLDFNNGTHINFGNVTTVIDALWNVNVSCWDAASNNNSVIRTFYSDITPPDVYLLNNSFTTEEYSFDLYFNSTESLTIGLNCSLYINSTLYNSTRFLVWMGDDVYIGAENIPEGNCTINLTCTDDNNNIGYNDSMWVMQQDNTNPLISFDTGTLANNSYRSQNYIYLNWTFTETNLRNITVYLYNSTLDNINATTFLTSTYSINFTGLSDGVYYFNLTCYDNASNYNETETRVITLDTTSPAITLLSPGNNSIQSSSDITLSYNVSDTNNVTNCTLNYRGVTGSTDTSINKSTTNQFSVYENEQGPDYSWYITCYDNSGNLGTSQVNKFSVSWSDPISDDTSGGGATEVASREAEAEYNATIAQTKAEMPENIKGNLILEIGYRLYPSNPLMGFIVLCGLIILLFLSFNTAPEFWKIWLWTSKNKRDKGW